MTQSATMTELQRRVKRKRMLGAIVQYTLAISVTIIALFPLYWMFISSFKSTEEMLLAVPTFWPREWHFENYTNVMQKAPFGRYFFNTIVVTLSTMLLQTIVGIFAAYGFAKGNFWGKDLLFVLVLGALMIPIQVTFIPIYTMVSKLGWINTFAGLIVPDAVSAYFIFMLRQNFMSVDNSYLEAARVDGMGRIGTIFRILVPMCKPAIVTVLVITFINGWNSYFWPKMVTTKPLRRTIALGVAELRKAYAGTEIMNFNEIMAGSLMSIVPVIILFLLCQKYILTGFSKNAMK